MLICILVGSLLTVATIGIHAIGSVAWIDHLRNKRALKSPDFSMRQMLSVLSCTALILLSLHILEVVIWAAAYLALSRETGLSTLEESVYFSMVTYTSLGYGDVVISGTWRLLSGIQAINGLLVFGWSTALLFAVVSRMWYQSREPGDS